MRILTIFVLILSLAACQQTDEDLKKPDTSESKMAKSEATDTKTNGNQPSNSKPEASTDFSLLSDLPYETVESDETCSEPVVIEFFAYQCPHCYKLESYAQAWKEQNAGKVKFQSVPTHLGHQEFGAFLIVHHAAERLGLLKEATPALFKRLHEEKQSFASQDDAAAFLVSIGATEQDAKAALDDQESGKTAINDDFRLLSKYKISGVPTILVNHRYKFDVTKAGGYDNVFKVVEETLKLPSNCSN